nr:hypothetical protein [Nanoarchaeum sp.]
MSTEIPQIQSIEKASHLYSVYKKSTDIVGLPSTNRRIVAVEDLRGLEGLVSNVEPYIAVADGIYSLQHDLVEFQEGIQETLEYAIQHIRGQFDGNSEAETQSGGTILGLIPYESSGQSRGKLSGDVNLGVYDTKNLVNTVQSSHQWLKDFIKLYVAEINKGLDSVESGEPNERLRVEIDRMNNAIKDCYKEENMIRLKFACQNLSGSCNHIREMMFPANSKYPELNNFLKDSKDYVDSLRQLIIFSQGKKRIGFKNEGDSYWARGISPELVEFTDNTPKPKKKRIWG